MLCSSKIGTKLVRKPQLSPHPPTPQSRSQGEPEGTLPLDFKQVLGRLGLMSKRHLRSVLSLVCAMLRKSFLSPLGRHSVSASLVPADPPKRSGKLHQTQVSVGGQVRGGPLTLGARPFGQPPQRGCVASHKFQQKSDRGDHLFRSVVGGQVTAGALSIALNTF